MGIVNTFEKCLESPYLSRDEGAAALVEGLLERADDRLRAARVVVGVPKADPADPCLLAYESMFCTLRALVYARGYREAGLRCLLLACEALYVRSGALGGSHLVAFERAQGLKLPPADAVDAAAAFLDQARPLLIVHE